MLRTLAVQNYRSLRRLVVPLTDLNVVTGPNGSGKSSLYRALRLLADASRNGAVAALAGEGGLPAALWAGPEKVGRAVREGRYPVQGTVHTEPVPLCPRVGAGRMAGLLGQPDLRGQAGATPALRPAWRRIPLYGIMLRGSPGSRFTSGSTRFRSGAGGGRPPGDALPVPVPSAPL